MNFSGGDIEGGEEGGGACADVVVAAAFGKARRAARETTPTGQVPATVHAAADALLQLWPEADHTAPDLSAVLRANTDILASHAAGLLWQPDGHLVLYRTGNSLSAMGLYTAATTHWYTLASDGERLLGTEHPNTLKARANLAASYRQAGRIGEALTLLEQVLADGQRLLGAEHPNTLKARANLAASYRQAGRIGEALTLQEQVLADRERLLGAEHPNTLKARANLAASYRQAGRTGEALTLQEQVLADRERLLGAEHPDTVGAAGVLKMWIGRH